jgi:glycosyltransferase involved in cell wall biosynthesis
VSSLISVAEAARELPHVDVLYLTISQSFLGSAKDVGMLSLAHRLGVPTVIHLHGGNYDNFVESLDPISARVLGSVVRECARVIVLSPLFAAHFAALGVDPARVVSIANPATTVIRGEARSRREGPFRVLYLSNMLREKGCWDVLSAARILAQREPGLFAFEFAGGFADTREQRTFERELASLGTRTSVRWHGIVGGPKKAALLDEADVFVLPTYYRNEGQPVAVIEALCAGLPCVLTRHRAIPEMVPAEMMEYSIEAHSPDQLADQLSRLRQSPSYESLSNAALAFARKFSPKEHVDQVEQAIRSAIQHKESTRSGRR